MAKRESVLTGINRLKYTQNSELMEQLLDTGDSILQEATTGPDWGIDAGIRSKAARENTGQGENIFGKILMSLRSEFTKLTTTTSDAGSTSSTQDE